MASILGILIPLYLVALLFHFISVVSGDRMFLEEIEEEGFKVKHLLEAILFLPSWLFALVGFILFILVSAVVLGIHWALNRKIF